MNIKLRATVMVGVFLDGRWGYACDASASFSVATLRECLHRGLWGLGIAAGRRAAFVVAVGHCPDPL